VLPQWRLVPGRSGWQDGGMSRIDVEAFEDAWDDDVVPAGRGRPQASAAARDERRRQATARVIAVDRGRIRVVADDDEAARPFDARYGGAMRGRRVVVGDRVRVVPESGSGPARVVERLERVAELRRTGDDLDRHERVVVANADAVAVVVGLDNLTSGLRFADRVLVAATTAGIGVLLVVNKLDLLGGPGVVGAEDLEEALAPYAAAVTAVLTVSAVTGEGIPELLQHLEEKWTVFTGHSGVGKSSLTNALLPGVEREIGEVGPRGGRHTTVASVAMPLPSGGWLVDTPGVRSFGLGMLDRRTLAQGFPELAQLECRLQDCAHDQEPGCALVTARIHPVRLAAFHRLALALTGVHDESEGGSVDVAALDLDATDLDATD
jgi:ribosome biogenesis GTPase